MSNGRYWGGVGGLRTEQPRRRRFYRFRRRPLDAKTDVGGNFSTGSLARVHTEPIELSYLSLLEAESIHIFREVVAECRTPVMLYSVGKDSSVMLHLARKAFLPGPIPFPLLHIDTGWKFREMIAFRDQMATAFGWELIVYLLSCAEI